MVVIFRGYDNWGSVLLKIRFVFSSNDESMMISLFSEFERLALELFKLVLTVEVFCDIEGTSKDFEICCVLDFANSFLL